MTHASDLESLDAPNAYPAPAKLNLFLHVIGRRADGYHLIESAMQLIDLTDTVTIVPRDDGVIARSTALVGIAEADDLALRAARLLKEAASSSASSASSASSSAYGATIGIEKRIPVGGGLGGGSSDAATTLLVLNRLWRLDWPRRRLMELGLALGADVPFFIGGTAALATGIGEALRPIALPAARYAVVHPGIAVPTPAIFMAPELTRDAKPLKILDFSKSGSRDFLRSDDAVAGAGQVFRNDLEAVAAARFPAVREALAWLAQDVPGASGVARMSGSGACVFRSFDEAGHARQRLAALPARWSGWPVTSLAVHPLFAPLAYAVD